MSIACVYYKAQNLRVSLFLERLSLLLFIAGIKSQPCVFDGRGGVSDEGSFEAVIVIQTLFFCY